MNKNIVAALLTLAMLVPLTGHAQGLYRSNNTSTTIGAGKVYLGVKAGILTIDSDDPATDAVDVTNMGFVFGGHLNDYLALEFDYTQTVSAEKEDFIGTAVKVHTDTIGLFLVARTTGDLYVKGRLGYSWIDQEITKVGSDTVYGLAGGLGAGYEFSDTFSLEAEYTLFPVTDEFDRFGSAGDLTTELVSINLVFSYD